MKSLGHQFLDFCRSKPADEKYQYVDSEKCALAQFAETQGMTHLFSVGLPERVVPLVIADALYATADECEANGVGVSTFGALTKRLETALADRLEQEVGDGRGY